MFEILLFSSLVYTLFEMIHNISLFFVFLPFSLFFFWLRYREMKREKIPIVFFYYFFFSGAFYIIYVKYLLKISVLDGPWPLLGILLFVYVIIEIFVRFILFGKFKTCVFLFSFILLFLVRESWLLFVIPLFLGITIFYREITFMEKEYGRYIKGRENLRTRWIGYSLPLLLFFVFSLLFLSFLPLPPYHFSNPIKDLSLPSVHSPIPDNLTPKEKSSPNVEGVITVYKYKEKKKELPGWLRRLASWKPNKSLIVDILLLEFGFFVFLFLYKIFSGMRFWYLFLVLSVLFALLSIGIFGYLVYTIGSYVLKGRPVSFLESKGGISSLFSNKAPEVTSEITKVITIEKEGHYLLPLILNAFLLLIFLTSIVVIFFVILKVIRKLEFSKGEDISVEEEKERKEYGKEKFKESFFIHLKSDPGYALEVLYDNLRSQFYPSERHLTPYELLKKIKKNSTRSEYEFWKRLTSLFVKVRYGVFFPERQEVLSLWEDYSAIFFSM